MQLLAKFKKILYMGFRATLIFRKFKDMWLRRSGFAEVSKTENNPGRPYFICRDRDCRFFQWADVELTKKNKNKQAKR